MFSDTWSRFYVIVGRGDRDDVLSDGSNNGLPMGSEVISLFTVYCIIYIIM